MRKILIINTGGLAVGGITTHIETYMSALLEQSTNYQVTMVATIFQDPSVIKKFEDIGCIVVRLSDRQKNLRMYVRELWHLMKTTKFDVIHVHGSSSILCIELLLAKMAGIKIRIAHSHNTMTEHTLANKLLFVPFKLSYNRALACSQLAGQWLFRNNRFIVLHNVFDYSNFIFDSAIRSEMRKTLSINDSTLVIGSVGYIGGVKNQKYILSLLSEIVKKRNLKYILVGDSPERKKYEVWVRENNLSDYVIFTGLRNDVGKLLQAFDIFVMPSIHEGLPIALLEAEATGLKCLVSSNVTKEAQLYSDAKFISLDKTEDWSEQITNYFPTDEERNQNSRKAQKILSRDYNLTKELSKLRKIYDGGVL